MERAPLFFLKPVAVMLGLIVALFLIELLLRIGGLFPLPANTRALADSNASIVFSGDSWTDGAEADKGKGFFDILKKDPIFKDYPMSNLGYGSNNGFQIVGNIMDRDAVPRIAVINMGVNSWHLIGIEKFIDLAYGYLSNAEIAGFRGEFKCLFRPKWFHHLKLYRLYSYLAASFKIKKLPVDFKTLDDKIGSHLVYSTMIEFWNTGPKDKGYEIRCEALSVFLKKNKSLSLDQKFYFAGLNAGFKTEAVEAVLKKAGLFFPEKLSIVPYSVYQELNDHDAGFKDSHEALIKWSFLVLSRWAVRHKVVVFIQTYPDIKKENMGEYDFSRINILLGAYARRHGFHIIDHNCGGIDWRLYRTLWHINNQGHAYMAENIKAAMSPFLKRPPTVK
ncbi:MAG TPA: hypothetical protein DER10_09660 [Elusimicrobia bacterium]|nr:hypothetical protein [Elusimicrobiota bacterium]